MNCSLLRARIDVFGKTKTENEFGEVSYVYNKITEVWAEIKPMSGKEVELPGEVTSANITHKFITRLGAIEKPRNDMFFKYKGQCYEVMYFMPNYKSRDKIEYYCKLKIEGDDDYGE